MAGAMRCWTLPLWLMLQPLAVRFSLHALTVRTSAAEPRSVAYVHVHVCARARAWASGLHVREGSSACTRACAGRYATCMGELAVALATDASGWGSHASAAGMNYGRLHAQTGGSIWFDANNGSLKVMSFLFPTTYKYSEVRKATGLCHLSAVPRLVLTCRVLARVVFLCPIQPLRGVFAPTFTCAGVRVDKGFLGRDQRLGRSGARRSSRRARGRLCVGE